MKATLMNGSGSVALALSVFAATAGAAWGHVGHHMTIDTAGGKTVIRVGFYESESDVFVDEHGRVFDGADILVARVFDHLTGPTAVEGWYAGEPFTLTSDFYFGRGRLDGGDFNFEIVSVVPVDGSAVAGVAWGIGEGRPMDVRAMSNGGTRAARSFNVGAGGHEHGQLTAVSTGGIYDVTLVAWDGNGVYADSEPVTFRLVATCPTDFNADGFVTGDDFDAFVAAFEAGDAEADFDEDGFVTGDDFDAFVAAFEQGC